MGDDALLQCSPDGLARRLLVHNPRWLDRAGDGAREELDQEPAVLLKFWSRMALFREIRPAYLESNHVFFTCTAERLPDHLLWVSHKY